MDSIMARKSRDTILREKLTAISQCPYDIFKHSEDSEELFELISASESGDSLATAKLIEMLYPPALADESVSLALLYFMDKAIALGVHSVAPTVIDYCYAKNVGYSLATRAISLLQSTVGIPDEIKARVIPLGAKIAVANASEICSYKELISDMAPLSKKEYPLEWLYVLQRARGCIGAELDSEIDELARVLGLEKTVLMPSFCGESYSGSVSRETCEKEISILTASLTKYESGGWRDLWLRCMYELLECCDKYDKRPIAESVIAISESRSYYKKHSLHTLAWCSYLLDFLPVGTPAFYTMSERYRKLRDRCAFEGIDPHITSDDERYALMRECVYLSTKEEQIHAVQEAELGFRIMHKKNRYVLECDLHGHGKRGRMHFWDATISIEASGENPAPPKIDKLTVSETKHVIERGGAVIDRGKTSSQAICYSEITVDEVRHPFEVDLILDISYISSVKCGEGEIRVLEHTVEDGQIVMKCQIFLY